MRDRRKEFGAFLKSRREATSPRMLGHEPSPRRRTPGLRREEVASAAGVGITWYTWLEQGRDIRPSASTLMRICRSLQLSPQDQEYVFLLADLPYREAVSADRFTPALARVLRAFQGPAIYLDAMWNILSSNVLASELYDLEKGVEPFAANLVWQCFRNPSRRRLHVNFDADMRILVGNFRRTTAPIVDEPQLQRLVHSLNEESAEFAALWGRRETSLTSPFVLELAHGRLGRVCVNTVRLPVEGAGGATVLFNTPADERTERLFDGMSQAGGNAREPFAPCQPGRRNR